MGRKNEGTYSRRDFFKQLAFTADDEKVKEKDQKTLVCIFLRGGADTLNMYVPYANDDYYKLRPNIAIKAPVKSPGKTSNRSPGRSTDKSSDKETSVKLNELYALHPMLAPLLPIWQEGRMAIVQAVGTDNVSGSHFACQDQIEHGESRDKNLGGGWLGRHLASRRQESRTPLSAVAIGTALPEALRGAPAASVLNSIDDLKLTTPSGDTKRVAQALARLYESEVDLLARPGLVTLDLLRRVEKMQNHAYKPANGADYADNNFSRGLMEVARLIKGKVGMEVACVDLNGWDTHFFQGAATGIQADSMDQLARGIVAFDKDLGSERQNVTVLVITEFGRRSYENSSMGTDHGRGFALMAIGDRLSGGQVHGQLPPLQRGAEVDLLGPSGLPIIFDYRSVLAEILVRGMDNHRMDVVFPGFVPQEVGLVKRSIA